MNGWFFIFSIAASHCQSDWFLFAACFQFGRRLLFFRHAFFSQFLRILPSPQMIFAIGMFGAWCCCCFLFLSVCRFYSPTVGEWTALCECMCGATVTSKGLETYDFDFIDLFTLLFYTTIFFFFSLLNDYNFFETACFTCR